MPRGIQDWSSEVSVVVRDALTEDIRKATKIVMPDEQIPPAKMPLTLQAAQKSPLIAVSSRITSKLVELGVRVHSVGVDRVTSSFFYIAEGGGEDMVTVNGDLVAAVAAMLGERADNAAIERVLDGLVDRLLRSLSRDRVTELGMELAAALPRAAADGSGAQDVDLEGFEKELARLVGASEKYRAFAQDIASKLADTYERKIEVPLFGEARKISQGPFDLTMGDQKVTLATYERWSMSGPLAEPKPESKPQPKAEAKPAPSPKPAAVQSTPKTAAGPAAAAPEAEPKAASPPKIAVAPAATTPKPAPAKVEEKIPAPTPAPKVAEKQIQPAHIEVIEAAPEAKAEEKMAAAAPEAKAEEKKLEPARVEKKAEEKKELAKKPAKAAQPPEKGSSAGTWIALLLLATAAFVVWRFFLQH